MLIDRLITHVARKKNADYLKFTPSSSLDIPPGRALTPTLLYMHIPFCEELCPYCSFNRVVFKEDIARAYYHALRKEILMYKDLGYDFQALYVGGGTPTVLIDELEQTIYLIKENYHVAEVSVETNPNHLTSSNIERLQNMGVNRLSVGVQTFDDGILKAVERYNKYGSGQEIAEKIKQTQGSFDTLNIDMIFNFPTQTMEILENDLSTLIGLGVDQITYYPLMASAYTQDMMSRKLGVVNYERGNRFYLKITRMLSDTYKASTAWCFSRKDRMVVPSRSGGLTEGAIPSGTYLWDRLRVTGKGEASSSHGEREGEAPTARLTEGAIPSSTHLWVGDKLRAPVIDLSSSHGEREGVTPTARLTEGATRAPDESNQRLLSREGEAPRALLGEGATRAPIIDEYVVNFDEYAGLGSGSIGYLGGSAYANTFDIQSYIDQVNEGKLPIAAKRGFSINERLSYDFLMKLFGLSLDLEQISIKHHVNAYLHLWPEILFFRLTGGLKKSRNMLTLTQKGQYYWVLMMREFFIGVNNFRDYCRAEMMFKK